MVGRMLFTYTYIKSITGNGAYPLMEVQPDKTHTHPAHLSGIKPAVLLTQICPVQTGSAPFFLRQFHQTGQIPLSGRRINVAVTWCTCPRWFTWLTVAGCVRRLRWYSWHNCINSGKWRSSAKDSCKELPYAQDVPCRRDSVKVEQQQNINIRRQTFQLNRPNSCECTNLKYCQRQFVREMMRFLLYYGALPSIRAIKWFLNKRSYAINPSWT